MAELKTKQNDASVESFISNVENDQRRADAEVLLKLFTELTGEQAKMRGSSIIGFGKIHYKYASGREGDRMATGFSPRKQNLSLYILSGFEGKEEQLAKLGKYKTGRGCLYINKLADIDIEILKSMIKESFDYTIKHQSVC